MNAAQSRGLIGLSESINKDNQNERNLAYMTQLHQMSEQKKQEQEQAAVQEQQYYALLNKQAEGLLAGDRKKIAEKALNLQREAKRQIKLYGGDKKKFLQNGGHSLLGGYINNVVGSEEMTMYKENKENLVRIMDAQQNGMGGLLLERDLASMQNYQKNGNGKITYSGLLTEIEIPPEENYDLGADIPLDDIMNHNSNMMKIMANYKMYHPNSPDPTPEELRAFANSMGYGGKGSNRDRIDFARKLALEKAKGKILSKEEAVKDARKNSFSVKTVAALGQIPKGTFADLYKNGDNPENTNWFKANQSNDAIRNLGLGDWNLKTNPRWLNEEGMFDLNNKYNLDVVDWVSDLVNPEVELAHSGQIFKTKTNELAAVGLQAEVDKNGYIESLRPDQTFFNTKGQQMVGENALEFEDYEGRYKVKGITSAMIAKTGKGGEQLAINIYDGDELDKNETKNFNAGMGDSELNPTTVIALEDDNGNIFYKEFNMFQTENIQATREILGDIDNLQTLEDAETKLYDTTEAAERQTAETQAQVRQNMKLVDDYLTNKPMFKEEAFRYSENGDSSLNRSTLMKAFYNVEGPETADLEGFTEFVVNGGNEAEKVMKDFSLTDEEALVKLLNIYNHQENSDVIENNTSYFNEIMRSLQDYNKLYNE